MRSPEINANRAASRHDKYPTAARRTDLHSVGRIHHTRLERVAAMDLTVCRATFNVAYTWLFLTAAAGAVMLGAAGTVPVRAEETVSEQPSADRDSFTRQELESAVVLGDPSLRFWGDSAESFRAALDGTPVDGDWVSLSGGAENGAFGAGLLAGWSVAGDRPNFSVVTGVSTGALMAPYVFIGSRLDGDLKQLYTTTTSPDIFEVGDGGRGESLLDTWPLRELIARRVTRRFLAAVANEHRNGRRLFVVTTSVDAQRPVVWNMGAIATRADKGLQLFRDVLLASASIPGVFPPVYLDAEVNGRRLREMHVDGAVNAPFYVAPEDLLRAEGADALPAKSLTVIMNQKLGPEFRRTPRSTLAILGQSLSVGVKAAVRGNLSLVSGYCRRTALSCHFAVIRDTFEVESRGVFDPAYMTALYTFGHLQGATLAGRWNETIASGATGGVSQQAGTTPEECAKTAPAARPQTTQLATGIEPERGLACAMAVPAQ